MSHPRSPDSRQRSFASLAAQVSGWTTNLLATAIVLVGGLALGWQVIAWWRDQPRADATSQEASLAAARLPDVGEGREFLTASGLLKVERVSGGPSDAIAGMRQFCRANAPSEQQMTAGPAEAQFVAQLTLQPPLEETGDVALYQPRGQTAMVVAVNRQARRIVGWSFALPAGEGLWSIYHFRPQAGVQSPRSKVPGQPTHLSTTLNLGPWTLDSSSDLGPGERDR
jgi:hypothetical protein